MKERQKPISKKNLDKWVDLCPETYCNDIMLRNYHRNKQLVDLDEIPEKIQDSINSCYDEYNIPAKNGLLNYFIKNKLKNLTEHIGEF